MSLADASDANAPSQYTPKAVHQQCAFASREPGERDTKKIIMGDELTSERERVSRTGALGGERSEAGPGMSVTGPASASTRGQDPRGLSDRTSR